MILLDSNIVTAFFKKEPAISDRILSQIDQIALRVLYQKPIPPQVQVNWNDILEELSTTAPKWETVEDAMNYARKRG